MNKSSISFAVGISLVSFSASAAGVVPTGIPNGTAMLSGVRQIAKEAGLLSEDIVIAQAPPTPQAVAATSPSKDELKDALTALIAGTHEAKTGDLKATFDAFGLNIDPKEVTTKNFAKQPYDGGYRYFSIVTFSGIQRLHIGQYVNGEYTLTSYLLSLDGDLIGAAKTTRTNTKLQATVIPLPSARTGYQELLAWWVQYYRENLKGKEQITARN